ncbi:hypothetical protein XENOCAPTIV_014341 [Xenoophorus captivus]|uniref:Uncharacterized protein n=1 Tax=Xenoophorus captivus TaxID=1517983 RepID=A0ABV0SI15_9TELE
MCHVSFHCFISNYSLVCKDIFGTPLKKNLNTLVLIISHCTVLFPCSDGRRYGENCLWSQWISIAMCSVCTQCVLGGLRNLKMTSKCYSEGKRQIQMGGGDSYIVLLYVKQVNILIFTPQN